MSDGFMLYLDDDGVARHYDDTYDITIHCESEEEQEKAIELIKSRQWIPFAEHRPSEGQQILVCSEDGVMWITVFRSCIGFSGAWLPLPEPYKGGTG